MSQPTADEAAARQKRALHLADCRRALLWRFGAGGGRVLPGSMVPMSYGHDDENSETIHVMGKGNSAEAGVSINVTAFARFGRIDSALAKIGETHRTVLSLAWGDAGAVATEGGLNKTRRWRAVAALTPAALERGAAWAARRDRMPEGPTSSLDVRVQQTQKLEGLRDGDRPEVDPEDRSWDRRMKRVRKACPPPVEPPAPSKLPEVTPPPWLRPPPPPKRDKSKDPKEVQERDHKEKRRRDVWAGPPAFRWLQWFFDPDTKNQSREDRSAIAHAEREGIDLIRAAEDAFAAVYVPTADDKPREKRR